MRTTTNTKPTRAPLLAAAVVASLMATAWAAAPATPDGKVTAKGYLNIGGTAITDLTGNAKFPDKPDVVYYYPYFEWNATGDINTPANNGYGDNYGASLEAYFYPPTSGDYIFYLSSDDSGNLYLSTDDDPANKKLIAQETSWSNPRSWDVIAAGSTSTVEAKNSQTFATTAWPTKDPAGGAKITLTKGKAYYIQALFKEGSGGDNLAVAVADPAGAIDKTLPIPGQYLSTFGASTAATITAQPQDASVYAGGAASFSVGLDLPPAISLTSIKWQKDNKDIADSNTNNLVLPVVAADNGAKIKAIVTTSTGTLTSSEATLNVATFTSDLAQGVVKVEFYTGISGTAISALTDDPKYTGNTPDETRPIVGIDTPNGYGDNYGARVTGFLTPPESGNYNFFVRSDDASQLWLSTDDTVAKAVLVAEETGCCQAFLEPDPSQGAAWHDNGAGMGQTTLTPISLTAGKKYAFYALLKEGGGGDFLQVAVRKDGDKTAAASLRPISGAWVAGNAKPNLGDPQITKQPVAPAHVIEGTSFSLSVAANVTPAGYGFPALVQWQKNGANVSGASVFGGSSASLTVSNTTSADSGKYTAVVSAPSGKSVTSTAIDIAVVPDTFPPVVQGATAFPGTTKVGLVFDENLDTASAQTAANYKVNGAAVVSAVVRTNVANELTNEKNLVQLTVAAALNADFTVTVTGVKDLKGNAMTSADTPGKLIKLTSTDIGSTGANPGAPDPQAPTTMDTWGPGAYDVLTTGSNDYWNNADGINFLWEAKTNSFDVKVRVVSVSPVNNWAAGAIMMREGPVTPNGGGWELARHYFIKADYGGPGAVPVLDGSGSGANQYEYNCRLAPGDPTKRETSNDAPGGSVGAWGTGGTGAGGFGPVPFPDAWIRMARVKTATSDHLLGYNSTDGVSWELRRDIDLNDDNHAGFLDLNGKPAGKWPDVTYVGLASTSHTGIGNNNAENAGTVGEFWYSKTGKPYSAFIIYRDYGDTAGAPPPAGVTIAFALKNGKVELTYSSGTLQSADKVEGVYTDVPGAASPYPATPSGTKFFRVRM